MNKIQSDNKNYYHNWLATSAPPNSYSIEIGYVDTLDNTISSDDSYGLDDIRWISMPFRFTNFAQAKIYGNKNYFPILFRVVGSSDKPNYFKYDTYQNSPTRKLEVKSP